MSSKKNNDNIDIEKESLNENENEEIEEEEEEENIINTKSKNNNNKTKNIEENEEIENEENEEMEENEENEENEEKEENEENEDELIQSAPIDKMNLDMSEIKLEIQHILDILSSFKQKREPGKSRHDYITLLKQYLKQYYDYNDDICDLILNLFSPNEAFEFMESNNQNKILTIRTNTLKTKRRELAKTLIQRGVNLDPLSEWSKVGLKIYSSQVPIGATPEYLSGQYMLQSSSSFLPILALDPQPKEKILDMCASPGGKATYIAQLMKNEGILVANDMKKTRLKSLFFNVHRMGIKNCVITNYDGRMFSKIFNKFDRVLLDAPCSGLGVISKDQSVKVNRSYKEILENSRIQKELILSAIDCCNYKSEGIIVYSTCTISVEENEWVVDYALRNRYVKCVEMGIDVGEKGFVKKCLQKANKLIGE
jgi:ribosomal RNA methyltransferase Nop2